MAERPARLGWVTAPLWIASALYLVLGNGLVVLGLVSASGKMPETEALADVGVTLVTGLGAAFAAGGLAMAFTAVHVRRGARWAMFATLVFAAFMALNCPTAPLAAAILYGMIDKDVQDHLREGATPP